MTKDELKQIYYLKKEVAMWEEELEKLEGEMYPQGAGGISDGSISDKTGRVACAIAECRDMIQEKMSALKKVEAEALRYIASIDDSHTRQIFYMRCVLGMGWKEIAEVIGGNTQDSVRMIFNRYCEWD
jgi:hypothetical protein